MQANKIRSKKGMISLEQTEALLLILIFAHKQNHFKSVLLMDIQNKMYVYMSVYAVFPPENRGD
jgi:hypothetical protein